MSHFLIPALNSEQYVPWDAASKSLPRVANSPFHRLVGLSRSEMADSRGMEAEQRRQQTAHFVDTFQWENIYSLLPLRLVVPPDIPPWKPRRCRSYYHWLPPEETLALEGLDDLDIVLRLFDFSPWRPIFAQRFSNDLGPPPYDPLSLGLAALLARWRKWGWPTLVTELNSKERGTGYCQRLGFLASDLPCESTFRMAVAKTASTYFQLCADSLALSLMAYGLIPTHSTFPGDSPQCGVSVALDSQLTASRSHMRCRHQQAACFLPRATRTCAAREKGKEGCACDTDACADHCRLATPRDPKATYVYYAKNKNRKKTSIPHVANITLATNPKPLM